MTIETSNSGEHVLKTISQVIAIRSLNRQVPSELVENLNKYPAEFIAQTVFAYPPIIPIENRSLKPKFTFEAPSQLDLEYAERDLSSLRIENNSEDSVYLQQSLKQIQGYLKLPYLFDGFYSQKLQREKWQRELLDSLAEVDITGRIGIRFDNMWDANKFRTGSITLVLGHITIIKTLLDDECRQKQVTALIDRFQKSFKDKDLNRTIPETDEICQIARDAIDLAVYFFSSKTSL